MQQPDSTVNSEPNLKAKSLSGERCGASYSGSAVPVDPKKPQLKRSSVISVDYNSDQSDSIINVKPVKNTDSRGTFWESDSICYISPSVQNVTKPSFHLSEKTSSDLDGSDLFFSPKKPETVTPSKLSTPANITDGEDVEPDDFYDDDFDIDDFNDSDIPEYFDEPQTSSGTGRNFSTGATTMKEGGAPWERKPTTPVSAPKPSKICSPGKSA